MSKICVNVTIYLVSKKYRFYFILKKIKNCGGIYKGLTFADKIIVKLISSEVKQKYLKWLVEKNKRKIVRFEII